MYRSFYSRLHNTFIVSNTLISHLRKYRLRGKKICKKLQFNSFWNLAYHLNLIFILLLYEYRYFYHFQMQIFVAMIYKTDSTFLTWKTNSLLATGNLREAQNKTYKWNRIVALFSNFRLKKNNQQNYTEILNMTIFTNNLQRSFI